MKCKFCETNTEKQVIFGIMEDEKNKRLVALVKVPYCDSCAKSVKDKLIGKEVKYGLFTLTAAIVCFGIGSVVGKGQFAVFGSLGVIAGAICLIKAFIHGALNVSAVEDGCLNIYKEQRYINGEDVVMPSANLQIPLSSSTNYSLISEKRIKEHKCMDRLEEWYMWYKEKHVLPEIDVDTSVVNEKPVDLLIQKSVTALVALYKQSPKGEGFMMNTPSAEPVREIGKQLEATGGFQLMLAVHKQFANAYPVMGTARNLEFLWDGIGKWKG